MRYEATAITQCSSMEELKIRDGLNSPTFFVFALKHCGNSYEKCMWMHLCNLKMT